MSRSSDAGKRGEWRERFHRFSSSGLAVARFCWREGVSVASFYRWRKTLGPEARRLGKTTGRGAFRRVAVVQVVHNVSIKLAGGTRIEVRAEHLDAVRTVLAELVRADRDLQAGAASC